MLLSEKDIVYFERKALSEEFKLQCLEELTRAITNKMDKNSLFRLYEYTLREQLKFSRFALLYFDQDWQCVSKSSVRFKVKNETIASELERFKEITVIESNNCELLNDFDVVVPVHRKDEIVAYLLVGGLDKGPIHFTEKVKSMPFVQTLTSILILAMESNKAAREQIKQERLKKDLEVASIMQKQLFPSDLPTNKQMDISAKYIPRHEVGGDYYDFIPIGNDQYIICIADVSGKGISAALLMATFQATVRTYYTSVFQIEPFNLKFLVKELNKKVYENAKGEKFITFFIAQYNAKTRELSYVNAGHNQPFITNGKEASLLEVGTIGLGMFEELPFLAVGTETLSPNTTLVLYTDGVVEIENEDQEYFELDLLIKNVHQFYRLSMEDMNSLIFSKLDEWRQKRKLEDDAAVFSCRFF